MVAMHRTAPPVDPIAPDRLETTHCALCGNAVIQSLFQMRGFSIVRCPICTFRFVSPRLKTTELRHLYSDPSYFKSANSLVCGYRDYLAERDNITATTRQRLGWIGTQKPGLRTGR